LRCKTAQSSPPLSTADFGATGGEDVGDEGEAELADGGEFDGNNSVRVSKMAGGIFRSGDEGGDDGTGTGSLAGAGGVVNATAGVILGSKGASLRDADAAGAESDVFEGVFARADRG
jgi:hypothetical protein